MTTAGMRKILAVKHGHRKQAKTPSRTRDHILDNITLYWLTGSGASAARSYWEAGRAQALAAGQAPPQIKLPGGSGQRPAEGGALNFDLDLVAGLDGRIVGVLAAQGEHHLGAAPRRHDQADAVTSLAGRPALSRVVEPQPR
jgi:hypothetical protein